MSIYVYFEFILPNDSKICNRTKVLYIGFPFDFRHIAIWCFDHLGKASSAAVQCMNIMLGKRDCRPEQLSNPAIRKTADAVFRKVRGTCSARRTMRTNGTKAVKYVRKSTKHVNRKNAMRCAPQRARAKGC